MFGRFTLRKNQGSLEGRDRGGDSSKEAGSSSTLRTSGRDTNDLRAVALAPPPSLSLPPTLTPPPSPSSTNVPTSPGVSASAAAVGSGASSPSVSPSASASSSPIAMRSSAGGSHISHAVGSGGHMPSSSPLSSSPSLSGSGSWSRVEVSAQSTMRRTPSSISLVKHSPSPSSSSSPLSAAQPVHVPTLSLNKASNANTASSSSSSSSSSLPSPGGSGGRVASPKTPPAFVPHTPSSILPISGLTTSLRSSGSNSSPSAPSQQQQQQQQQQPENASSPGRRSLLGSPRHGSGASELARRALNTSGDMVAMMELSGGVGGGGGGGGGRGGLASSSNASSLASSLNYSAAGLDGAMSLNRSVGGWTEYPTIDPLRVRRLTLDELLLLPHHHSTAASRQSARDMLALLLKHQDRLFKVAEHEHVPEPLFSLFEHLTNNGLAVEDLFAFKISRPKVEPLYNLVMHKGMSLANETNVHVVSEMLLLALERLPRRPFHFAHFEPLRSFDELEGEEAGRVKLAEEVLKRVDAVERQVVGLVVGLLGHLVSMAEVNGANEELLLHIFAPLLVDGKWLTYRKPPTVKLCTPFIV